MEPEEVKVTESKKVQGYDEWEINSATDCLRRAMGIASDKKLFGLAKKGLMKQSKDIKKALDWASEL